MKISFYFDEMLNRPLAEALIKQDYTVILANDIDMTGKTDSDHLSEATKRGMVLVTLDRPFAGRVTKQTDHAGLICWTGEGQNIGIMLQALTNFAKQYDAEETASQVFWLK